MMNYKAIKNKSRKVISLALAVIMTVSCFGFVPLFVEASTALSTPVQVVAGANHTLVRLQNGDVWAWGSNERGQLGIDNSFALSNSAPVRVPTISGATYIAAGHNSSYAIVNGELLAWGCNLHGQLGTAQTLPNNRRFLPVVVSGIQGAQQVAAGYGHVLVRTNNEVLSFGRNDFGQTALTNNTASIISSPTITGGEGSHSMAIAAGEHHSLLINNRGDLWGAGNNSTFQIARFGSLASNSIYRGWNVSPGLTPIDENISRVTAGNDFTLVLTNSNIFSYDSTNTHHRAGQSPSSRLQNTNRRANGGTALNNQTSMGFRNMIYVSAGHNHSLSIDTEGNIFAWGDNSQGQLGIGSATTPTSFLMNRVNGVVASTTGNLSGRVAGGANHSVAIAAGGAIYAWGNNSRGQLGNGTITSSSTPVQILPPGGVWIASGEQTVGSFTIDAAGRIITFTGNVMTNNLVIPNQVGTITVTGITTNAFDNVLLSGTLTLPSTLTTIEANAFSDHNLVSVTIPNSVLNIGANAFRNNNISNLTISAGGTGNLTIGANAFRENALTTIELPARVNSIGDGAFANNPNLTTARFLQTDTSRLRTFAQGGMMGDADIFVSTSPNLRLYRLAGNFTPPAYHGRAWNITGGGAGTSVGDFSFTLAAAGYTITGYVGSTPANGAIVFPATGPSGAQVIAIGSTVFQGVPQAIRNSITSISFQSPSSVATIGSTAFLEMTNLRSATIPASVTLIGSSAFAANSSLQEVHFEHANGHALRVGQVFADATIFSGVPAGLRLTRPSGSDAATYVPFNSPATIARNWYVSDGNVAWWTITPATGTGPVTITGFTGPNNLTTITIPSTVGGRQVTGISTNVLTATNAPLLQEVVVPASVTTFAANAIVGQNLTTVRLLHHDGAAIQNIPANTFGPAEQRNANFRILFPALSVGFTEPTWRSFPTQADLGGYWTFADWADTGLIITGFTGNATSVRIPSSIGGRPVTHVGPNVFNNNSYVRELIIPSSVVFMADNAVNNAPNLEIVYLQHTNANILTYFPTTAFTGTHADLRLYFPNGATNFTTPLWEGFRAYPQRWTYEITNGEVTITGFTGTETVIAIPSSILGFPVRTIASQAFANNQNITSIVIPQSVTRIQSNAIFNCRNLTTAVFEHSNAAQITYFASYVFVGVADNFRILFPYNATGFTTPVWRGYVAEPQTGETILRYGNFEYTIRRVTLPGTGNISRDEVVITRYVGTTTVVNVPASIAGLPVAGLGDTAFFQNTLITEVHLPASLRTIGTNTFSGATALTSISIPAGVTTIGASAFMGATSLNRAFFYHTNAANITIGENTFTNTASTFRIIYPAASTGFTTPNWRGFPAGPSGGANNQQPGPGSGGPTILSVRTTDNFPGVTGPPLIFRDGVGYISIRAFALLIGSNPDTQIQFHWPEAYWATITGTHTNGSLITLSVTANDIRSVVTHNGIQHEEFDLATWAGPLTGRARGQLRTRLEGGNLFIPFRAAAHMFGYELEFVDDTHIRFIEIIHN